MALLRHVPAKAQRLTPYGMIAHFGLTYLGHLVLLHGHVELTRGHQRGVGCPKSDVMLLV